jgi:hypothetical protein
MAIHMPRRSPLASLAVVLALVVPAAARAQRDSAVVSGAPRESTMAVGAHYRAGGLHRLFFGDGYRLLWTTPLPVPVLDFHALGGLTPTTAGGGQQTKSLRFDGGDGFRYGFRSVDKEPVIPPGLAELEGTFVQEIIRDGTSATHPGAPAVAAGLLTAAGVLHTEATLVVIPAPWCGPDAPASAARSRSWARTPSCRGCSAAPPIAWMRAHSSPRA